MLLIPRDKELRVCTFSLPAGSGARARSAGSRARWGTRPRPPVRLGARRALRRVATRAQLGAMLLDSQRPGRPAAVAIAGDVAEDRVVVSTETPLAELI